MADILPGFIWDKGVSRYRNAQNQRFVSRSDINGLLREQVQSAESRLSSLATAFHEGKLAPSIFVEQASVEIKRLALQNVALGSGGFSNISQSAYGRAGASLRDTYAKIIGTAQDVVDGKVSLPQLLNRVNGYVGESRKLYFQTAQDNAPQAPDGMTTIFRRILDDLAMHCEDCVNFYNAGFGLEYVAPGDQCACKGNCRCGVIQRDVPTDELDQWIGSKR